MKSFLLVCIVLACALVSTQAYTINTNNAKKAPIRFNKIFKSQSYTAVSTPSSSSSLFMSGKDDTNLVPVDKQNIENAAAVTGGILGFFLAGPLAGFVLAAVSNYVVKKDNDSGEALRGLGKSVVESYNYLSKMNSKYKVTDKVQESVTNALDSAATESDTAQQIKEALDTSSKKVTELNKEFDLFSKAKSFTSAAADLSDKAMDTVDEANKKYDFIKVAKETTAKAIDAAMEQSKRD